MMTSLFDAEGLSEQVIDLFTLIGNNGELHGGKTLVVTDVILVNPR
jgi:hypothetical protein